LQEQLGQANQDNQLLQSEVQDADQKYVSLMDEKSKIDEEIMTLKDLLSSKKSEQEREIRAREKLEVNLRQTQEVASKKEIELNNRVAEIKLMREQMSRMESGLREEHQKVEKTDKDIEVASAKIARLQQEYEEQVQANLRLLNENQKHAALRKEWEEELQKNRDDLKMVSRSRDALTKRIKQIEESRSTAEIERDKLKVGPFDANRYILAYHFRKSPEKIGYKYHFDS
jgi:chromosome segregation ATPase